LRSFTAEPPRQQITLGLVSRIGAKMKAQPIEMRSFWPLIIGIALRADAHRAKRSDGQSNERSKKGAATIHFWQM
jgi:hypothetical protein